MLKVLLIGYGAIGKYVFNALAAHKEIEIAQILCRKGREKSVQDTLGANLNIITDVCQFDTDITTAIDCAGHQAIIQYGVDILSRGIDLFTVSNGALSDDQLFLRLEKAARENAATLRYLSGAIGAVDALAAAKTGGLTSVHYKGKKPPAAWKGSPAETLLDLDTLTKPTSHFKGSARQAARQYPQNANVAATIALAGLGMDKTIVELVADPEISANIHEIQAVGKFGEFSFSITGSALENNPKSSALTAMCVVNAITNLVSPIQH